EVARRCGDDGRKGACLQRNYWGRGRAARPAAAAVADVPVSELESRFSIVALLRHDAVESDGAGPGMGDGRIPNAQAVAAAAQIGAHDVETEERESAIVIEAGDGRGGHPVELADEKAVAVDAGKAGGIGEARIPAFRRRPIERDGDLFGPHGTNAQLARGSHFGLPAFMPEGPCLATRRRSPRGSRDRRSSPAWSRARRRRFSSWCRAESFPSASSVSARR